MQVIGKIQLLKDCLPEDLKIALLIIRGHPQFFLSRLSPTWILALLNTAIKKVFASKTGLQS